MLLLDIKKIRQDFLILDQIVNDEPLVYLDNAATTQKPQQVLDALNDYYHTTNANVHRGVHTLAERATAAYEASREKVRSFINAKSTKEVLFTRGTTTGLNWLAKFAEEILQEGDEVLISIMEHHSNIIPWQEACRKTGAKLVYAYIKDGALDVDDLRSKLSPKTKFVSLAHVSNVLGAIAPVKEIAELAHGVGAYMVVDGAQSAPHMAIDVQDLDCDFYTLSGHKMLAPTGIGVLYGKEEILNQMSPVEFGGEMIDFVYEQEATWKELPWKFEAGTPNIAGAIALGAALDYLTELGMDQIHAYEQELVNYVLPKLQAIEGLTVYGPQDPSQHAGVIAFNIDGLHPHDVATALDYEGVAVRAGHHCAQPLINHLGISSAARASFYIYNTKADCDKLVDAILKTKEFFNGTF
ncbi:cysteine desulfurase [Streptococcus henryi]|uniref:cysteine desulfurase n=1 Tax=Streptococcus henryi TaxID=439219 RepID=UPI000476F8C3|nr:cysteine desulfurase [Streptococcus henryi]